VKCNWSHSNHLELPLFCFPLAKQNGNQRKYIIHIILVSSTKVCSSMKHGSSLFLYRLLYSGMMLSAAAEIIDLWM